MCGRYTLSVGFLDIRMQKLLRLCALTPEDTPELKTDERMEIRPGDYAPVLMVANGATVPTAMQWGFTKSEKSLIINARIETAPEKKMFAYLISHNRCALPAAGYYEWRDSDHLRHLITQPGGEPFYLAGLYRREDDGVLRFVILTRAAVGAHSQIHARMPVVLQTRHEARQWIHGVTTLDSLQNPPVDSLSIQPMGDEQLRMDFDDHSAVEE